MENPQAERILALLRSSPERGWRLFVDEYTPAMLSLIERAGLRDRDEAMEIYVSVCERLSARQCERLRRYDPRQGDLTAWLAAVVRHATVDWVRSRAGRRRLFDGVKALDPLAQDVFQHYYWHGRSPTEIAGLLASTRTPPLSIVDIFEALERVERALDTRQRAELAAWTLRSRLAAPAEQSEADVVAETVPGPTPTPEDELCIARLDEALNRALAALPHEDAVIVRLKFLKGLSNREIARALRLPSLTSARISAIVAVLRAALGAEAPAGDVAKYLSVGGGA